MGVVVHDPHARHLALGLEPAAGAGEASQPLQDPGRLLPQAFGGSHERGSRVEQVVSTRHADLEAAKNHNVHSSTQENRVRVQSGGTEGGEPHVGIRCQAVGDHPGAGRPGHLGQGP